MNKIFATFLIFIFFASACAAQSIQDHSDLNHHEEALKYDQQHHRYNNKFESQTYSWMLSRYFYDVDILNVEELSPELYTIWISRQQFIELFKISTPLNSETICFGWYVFSDSIHPSVWVNICTPKK